MSKYVELLSEKAAVEISKEMMEDITICLDSYHIPTVFKHEYDTDEATLEFRAALVHYIGRLQKERQPCIDRAVKTAMTSLARRKRPGARGLIRNPNGRKGKKTA